MKLKKIKFKKLITIILTIAGTATFGQFIIEEALQNYGFGVSMLIMNKMYRNSLDKANYTQDAVKGYQDFHNNSQKLMNLLYIGNPLTALWFQKFMEADNAKLVYYRKLTSEEIFYLTTKQERKDAQIKDKYLTKKDKEHIDSILKLDEPKKR